MWYWVAVSSEIKTFCFGGKLTKIQNVYREVKILHPTEKLIKLRK